MPTFEVPFSSSPQNPATPESKIKARNALDSSLLPSHPSTTPAGPPPSSIGSFTPSDPPPPSLLESSPLGSSRVSFKPGGISKNNSPLSKRYSKPTRNLQTSSIAGFSSPNRGLGHSDFGLQKSTATDSEYGKSFTRGNQSKSQAERQQARDHDVSLLESDWENSFLQSPNSRSLLSSPKRVKYNHEAPAIDIEKHQSLAKSTGPVLDSAIAVIANDMARQIGMPPLSESDGFILATEQIMGDSTLTLRSGPQSLKSHKACLLDATAKLSRLWSSQLRRKSLKPGSHQPPSIQATAEASLLEKAVVLSLLTLKIHYSPVAKGSQASALLSDANLSDAPEESFPEALLDWLDKCHDPWSAICMEVIEHPSPPNHFNFWDTMFSLMLRGKLHDAIELLDKSTFGSAETAPRDGYHDGYAEGQTQNIQMITARVARLLRTCPAVTSSDWEIVGNDWSLFRRHVEVALDELIQFVETEEHASDIASSTFALQKFYESNVTTQGGRKGGRGESRIPWTPYQSLRLIYGILLGRETEIMSSAQDWIEATIGLTIWWNGDDGNARSRLNLDITKYALKEARQKGYRLVDLDYEAAYLNRLAFAFHRTTDAGGEQGFQLNSNSPLEIAVASVFENNFQGMMGILHAWSLVIASTMAEIAALGGWFSISPGSNENISNRFDEADLMVLSSYGHQEQGLRRDKLMIEYANALFDRGTLHAQDEQVDVDSWKLSLSILQRINDDETARQEISKALLKLPLDSPDVVNEIVDIAARCKIKELGMKLSETYADSITENSDDYGVALLFYARAHQRQRVKNVLDLLLSISLMRSEAYPPADRLDQTLKNLLYDPVTTFDDLANSDSEAAALLHRALTGYAALRKFYNLRDQQSPQAEKTFRTNSSDHALSEAANILLAVIKSASQTISGGLYDANHESIVQYDGLLTLLGEALVLINRNTPILTPDQSLVVLQAVEDLQTVPHHIFEQSEVFLRSVLASYRGHGFPESPRKLLKTMSSMTSGTSFSLVSSSLLESLSSDSTDHAMADSKDTPAVEKGWDWREGMPERSEAGDLLRMLRLGLARNLARSWVDCGDG